VRSPLTPDAEDGRKARARAEISEQARRGMAPRDTASADVIAWAFEGFEDHLASLEETASAVREDRAARHRASEERNKIKNMTDRILGEWDKAEARERRAKAEKEARKRLGLA
jgi:hypothetical protein